MQALEQQVGELRMDDAEASTGVCEADEGKSPKRRAPSTDPGSSWPNARPKSVGDPLDGEREVPVGHPALPRSFSAPYPALDNTPVDSWQWDHVWEQQPVEDLITEEDYQQAVRVEGYIVGLVRRHALASRPRRPRAALVPDAPARNSAHRRAPCLFTEKLLLDPVLLPQADLSTKPTNQKWGCDLVEEEACGGEAPSSEGDSYLSLPYPQSRSHSLTERLPSPLPSADPNGGAQAFEPPSPQNCIHPHLQTIHHKHTSGSACFTPGQAWRAPVPSPRPGHPVRTKSLQTATSDDRPGPKPKSTKKNHTERQRAKKSGSKTSRSQSENSLLGQQVLPERRYSTTERHQNHQVTGPQAANNSQGGRRRWCSNLELSQDEGETLGAQGQKRQQRKARSGHPGHPSAHPKPHHHYQRPRPEVQERAPLCQEEDGYAAAAPAESESSMSEVYSPASSSLSSDSDESGGLVWPQQLPPRLASTSSSSSPSPQATANAAAQPKAFVKIKASHALKRKILRFRSGSLKVMTTV